MKIKNRLSLYFALISSGVLLAVFITIYLSFVVFFRNDFYARLTERATVAARLYLEADEISADSLEKIQRGYLNELPDETIHIYDSDNHAAFIREKRKHWNGAILDQIRKKGLQEFVDGARQVVGIYHQDNQGNFVILVSALDRYGMHRLDEMRKISLILFFGVSVSLFLIGRVFAEKALQPLDEVVNQMQKIRATNLHLRVDEGKGKDEISKMAQSFNQLLEHLENAFEMQKTYIANASHELRTPVTSMIGEIEVALYHPRSEAEYQLLLKSVLQDSERLKDTISSLMDLAQVDADYTLAEQENVRVDDLIWELQNHWKRQNKGDLEISMLQLPEDENRLLLSANRHLLLIALNNIIGNAFKFSDNQPVNLSLLADEKQIRIVIKDHGIGIATINQTQIFNPFYRGDNAQTYMGSGIGLYIADKVIKLFGGTISFISVPNEGTEFLIVFSSAKNQNQI
ncbi:MAG: HAMP domain-containing protein [Sphingobacteriaceae bacterium]|nr:MAG: HAMP domain-containing protein [Sphingobacteriaceae bacterium]